MNKSTRLFLHNAIYEQVAICNVIYNSCVRFSSTLKIDEHDETRCLSTPTEVSYEALHACSKCTKQDYIAIIKTKSDISPTAVNVFLGTDVI